MNVEISEPVPSPKAEPESGLERLRATLRAGTRITAIFAWTFPWLAVRLLSRPVALVSPAVERAARRGIMKSWSAGTLRMLNVRVNVVGAPPTGRFFMVVNHLSYLDVFVLARHLGCVFVAQHEMADWPFVGLITRAVDTIFINRKSWRELQVVNEAVAAALAGGQSVLMFPESTTSYGLDLLPFRAALLEAPIAADVPVHYAALQYHRTRECPDPEHDVCWVDDIPFGDHVKEFLRVPRVDATLVFAEVPVSLADRKTLARTLETSVREILPTRDLLQPATRTIVS